MTDYKFTITRGQRDSRFLKEYAITEQKFKKAFLKFYVGEKDGDAIIPALFSPCPPTCHNKKRGAGLDCGGSVAHRLSMNVRAMTMLGADIDDVTPERFEAALEKLRSLGLKFCWWHTHSYKLTAVESRGTKWALVTPSGEVIKECTSKEEAMAARKVRARILIPFDVPLELKSPSHWSRIAWPALMNHVGIAFDATDRTCKDPARVFFTPRIPHEGAPHQLGFEDGAPLRWRDVIGNVLDVTPAPDDFGIEAGPTEDPSRPVDLEAIRETLKNSRNPIARLAGKGEALTPAPDKRQPGQPSRYEAWRTVTGVLSLITEGWESSTALMELLRPSWLAEASESPDDFTDIETIADLLSSARASAPAAKARRAAEEKAEEALFLRRASMSSNASALKTPESEGAPTVSAEIIASAPKTEVDSEWESELTFTKARKDEGPKLRNTMRNTSVILSKHPLWAGMLRKNLLTHEVEVWGGPLRRGGQSSGRPLDDNDIYFTQMWLSKHYDIEPSSPVLWDILRGVGTLNEYDPLRDYLEGLQWDGVPRLATWLQKYVGASTQDGEGNDITNYLQAVGRKWAISAVARALQPGCKVDTVLTFEGLQGKKKSTMLKVLGGKFTSDSPVEFLAKDSLMMLNRFWLIELAEVASLRRSEVATQRAFLSRQMDDFRAPYERTLKRCPRRCVFVGTSNEDDYLQDDAGNRRHWPVAATELDLEGLAAIRDQFWAEAVTLFKAGEIWYLTPEEQLEANTQTTQRQSMDLYAEKITAWVVSMQPSARPEFVSTLTVCQDALGESPTRGLEMRLSRALRRCGFVRTRAGKIRGYAVPQALLEAPAPVKRPGLMALPGA